MKTITILFILFLSCFQYSIAQTNMRLQTGQTFEVDKIFCVNRDTLFLKLKGTEQPYKVAMKDVAYLNRAIFGKLQNRKFKEKFNWRSNGSNLVYKNMNSIITINVISGVVVSGFAALTTAAILYVNTTLKTVPFIIATSMGGLIPGILITNYNIQYAIDYRAFRDAKELKTLEKQKTN
jgi:hypothetical protein